MYLATVIDTYSRKLAGYALADHMRVSLVIEALSHASTVRGSLDGAIFHSDHGSVYTEVPQVLFRLSRWENLEHAEKI